MPKLTLETCKAPQWTEFPKLAKLKADAVFAEALEIKREIAKLKAKLAKVQPRAQAKLELAGIDPDVKSVLYEELLITRRAGHSRRSLDKTWAVRKLLALKVSKAEIDEHTKVTEIEPGISFQLLGDDSESGDE